jgi:hypothetical protein
LGDGLLAYGNLISAGVILLMGIYLLYLVYADRIHLRKHHHHGQEHVHIYFGKEHSHEGNAATASALTVGALMGIGGVRGMLVTLGAIQGQAVDWGMLLAFTSGVIVVFLGFGVVILYINRTLLHTKQNVRRIFAGAGIVSVLVGSNMLIADEPLWGHSHGMGGHTHAHTEITIPHTHPATASRAEKLVQSKHTSNMTYRQMMQQMGESFKMLQTGVLTQNRDLIRLGADMIQHHPAPKTKPWLIMPAKDQEAFKETLIAYDKLLHGGAGAIIDVLEADFDTINNRVHDLSTQCISCHAVWQTKPIK